MNANVCHKQVAREALQVDRSDLCSCSLAQDDFFAPPLASCCEMMNSRISLAVLQGFSIATEWPQFSSRSTLHPGSTPAMTEAPDTSTT